MTEQGKIEKLFSKITAALTPYPFVRGVVLGGSRATGTATDTSDVDIGIYYSRDTVDFDRLNEITQGLDDERRAISFAARANGVRG